MSYQTTKGYSEVVDLESHIEESKWSASKRILCAIFGVVLTTVIALLTASTILWPTHAHVKDIITCGHSIETAQTSGCLYDPLTVRWLPPQCPRTGTDDFAKFNDGQPWRYWADSEGSREFKNLALQFDASGYYTTNKEHLAHCAFMLIRVADALRTGERVDDMTADYDHSKHCAMLLLNRSMSSPTVDEIQTWGRVKLGTCSYR